MKRQYDFMYIVYWGNGFVGGYSPDFEQIFNTPEHSMLAEVRRFCARTVHIIYPRELDELRGYHKPNMSEYFQQDF